MWVLWRKWLLPWDQGAEYSSLGFGEEAEAYFSFSGAEVKVIGKRRRLAR
jgi:hypothetical protein